ncbi:MAG: Erythromycin esterase [Gemmatimonadetes bacterium]|nr:Erythromycin esterase [Gemmatimonadota bacterium]
MAAAREHAVALSGGAPDHARLLSFIGDARVVLIGEASHGTHEFYQLRAELTRRLVTERQFSVVVAEADWPDAYRADRYVRGLGRSSSAGDALSGFERFPTWMWRNGVTRDFLEWLRSTNDAREPALRTGFLGMDLYSMYRSMACVIQYLEGVDPDAARRARHRYECFEHFQEDSQAYGYAATSGASRTCEDDAVRQLMELQQRAPEYAAGEARGADDVFSAEQNARLVANAERYYRSMFEGRANSWNLRDSHMADTLLAVEQHLEWTGQSPKMVVWAHNSHLGDARATSMGRRGELNVGQLVRERWPGECVNIGFTTHTGSVTAASDWDAPAEIKAVRPSLPDSWERVMHDAGGDFFLPLRDMGAPARALFQRSLLERAIGVIYRPETERQSHYFHAELANQFDAIIHVDETRALEPLSGALHT